MRLHIFVLLIRCIIGNNLFYIYDDCPPTLKDTWPPSIMNNSNNHSIFHQFFTQNRCYGPLIERSSGMFNSWQFSLFKMVYTRLLSSIYRTDDPEKASVFFLPFDGGVDSLISSYDGRLIKNRCPRSGIAKAFLQRQKYFSRHNGLDHFMLFSVIQGVSSLNSPGCKALYRDICKNCLKLTIEVSYHLDKANETSFIGSKRIRSKTAYQYDPTWISVPYPSSFHFWEYSTNIPWKVSPDILRRNITAVFVGGTKTINKISKALRARLHVQCSKHPSCIWLDTGIHRTRVDMHAVLNLYRSSIFCLSPPGDSPTRKGLFDSILAGCIPVVFDKYTLANQYPWHIGLNHIEQISVFIPVSDILGSRTKNWKWMKTTITHSQFDEDDGGVDFMEILSQIPPVIIERMQHSIEKLGWSLQYSIPPENASIANPWSPPLRDGVDIIIENVFAHSANSVKTN